MLVRNSLLLALALMLASCAGPIAGLWPPAPDATKYRVLVSVDAWHSAIGLWPPDDPSGVDPSTFREWGYADRNFYLDGDDGFSGSCAALFWPTDAVIQVAAVGVPYYKRALTPPVRHWWFELSEEGYNRLVAFLEAERSSTDSVSHLAQARWYPAKYNYQIFHHCLHWTTRALREAGLPVWSSYALFRWSFVAQLDRVGGFAVETPAPQ